MPKPPSKSPYKEPAPPRRGRKKRGPQPRNELTSLPTSRNAMVDTRAWLLKQYGPHCAYCGLKFAARVMTLDHVAPRRGQTAYDRRDNLVLCCQKCNAAKRDSAPLAFLLGAKGRAMNLLRYGGHLSSGLLDMARPLVKPEEMVAKPAEARHIWGVSLDNESPYRD